MPEKYIEITTFRYSELVETATKYKLLSNILKEHLEEEGYWNKYEQCAAFLIGFEKDATRE